jgi:hypothetical protein
MPSNLAVERMSTPMMADQVASEWRKMWIMIQPRRLDELHELFADGLVGLPVALADDVAAALLVVHLLPAPGVLELWRLAHGRLPSETEFVPARNAVLLSAVPPSKGRPVAAVGKRPADIRNTPRRAARRDEDPIPFREPHRRIGRRFAMADFPGRPRPHPELEAGDDLAIAPIYDKVASHALIGGGAKVRVIPTGESCPAQEVKSVLEDGRRQSWFPGRVDLHFALHAVIDEPVGSVIGPTRRKHAPLGTLLGTLTSFK